MIRKALKLLIFGLVLLVLSAVYRLLGDQKITKEAKADPYSQSSYYSEGGYGGSEGVDGSTCGGCCEGGAG